VGSRGEVGEDPVPPAPTHGDERDLVRTFTDLHRQDHFTPAARPVAPMRARRRPARDLIDAQAIEAHVVDTTTVADHPVDVPDRMLDTPVDQPRPPLPGGLPHRPPARPTSRPHHHVPRRPRVSEGAGDVRRRGWAGTAERRLSDVLALAGATGALIVPWLWLGVVATLCLVIGAVRSVATGRRPVVVGIVALPWRAGRRIARLVRPRSLARLPLITVRTILAAIVLPGVVAAAIWVAAHGADGMLAAARMAAWQSGLRVLAAVLCLMMLAGVGETRARRAARLRRATASWSDAGVVALAAGALVLALTVVAVGPRVSGGLLTGQDGLAWVPAPWRPAVDGVRDDVVAAELRTLQSCLAAHQEIGWSVDYTADNPVGARDVARLSLGGGDEPDPAALVTAALAADNQLAPWVEVVEITHGDTVVLELDRQALGHHGVRVDPATLGPGIVSGGGVAVAGGAAVDRGVALVCSAGPAL
jgi:hypothetical protein